MGDAPPRHQHDAAARGSGAFLSAAPATPFKLAILAVAAIAAFGGLLSLGIWQMQRLAWKEALIERVDQRIHAEPVAAPGPAEWPSVSVESSEYLKVRLTGKYLHDKETLVQAVTVRGPGFWVMTPLQSEAGDIVLVNRGFVPPQSRPAPVAGTVTVTGLLRLSETGKQFLRENDPAADRWYARDVDAIAAARGLNSVAPYFIDADAVADALAPGVPLGGLTVVSFRNSHLQYALTWVALAIMVAGGAFLVFRHEWRLRQATSNTE